MSKLRNGARVTDAPFSFTNLLIYSLTNFPFVDSGPFLSYPVLCPQNSRKPLGSVSLKT
jgi:hypothetical protein